MLGVQVYIGLRIFPYWEYYSGPFLLHSLVDRGAHKEEVEKFSHISEKLLVRPMPWVWPGHSPDPLIPSELLPFCPLPSHPVPAGGIKIHISVT